MAGADMLADDLIDPVLDAAGQFCADVLLPLNRSGDEEGCRLDNGVVRTPKGFKEAYAAFADGGWTSISCDPAYGGQGLPTIIGMLVQEMICATNLSFGLYPGLSHGAYAALATHAGEELKQTYLPHLVSGRWSGTMCLTEPHCGTDLGLLRTTATPADDGSYRINGTKIFISAGDHDLTRTSSISCCARLSGAPKGIKGISLFVVPKFIPAADGLAGPRNGVSCGALEHKMGLKASATCVLNFDDAKGWLVGAPHKGMQAMFTMMNSERLAVGIQGLGLAEASYQGAVAYARERLQGRAPAGPKAPDKPADPIIVHPDVRRMLLTMRANTEGMRAFGLWVAEALDLRERHPDAAARGAADDFVALMTPVVKALFTDLSFETANLGVQVFGGHGYIREHGMEQHVRDARITQLYEGTNGIQALDLVARKLPAHAGRLLQRFFHPVAEFIAAQESDPAMAEFVLPLSEAFARLRQATAFIAQEGLRDPAEPGAAASDYLRLFGLVAMAFMWARMAQIALDKTDDAEMAFYRAKLGTARFFMQRMLPQSGALLAAILAGGKSMSAFEDAAF